MYTPDYTEFTTFRCYKKFHAELMTAARYLSESTGIAVTISILRVEG